MEIGFNSNLNVFMANVENYVSGVRDPIILMLPSVPGICVHRAAAILEHCSAAVHATQHELYEVMDQIKAKKLRKKISHSIDTMNIEMIDLISCFDEETMSIVGRISEEIDAADHLLECKGRIIKSLLTLSTVVINPETECEDSFDITLNFTIDGVSFPLCSIPVRIMAP